MFMNVRQRFRNPRNVIEKLKYFQGLFLFTLVIFYPAIIRFLLLKERAVSPELVDVTGWISDISIGIVAGVLVAHLLNFNRLLACLAGFLWFLINIAAYEYIRFFDSPYALSHANYLFDSTFFIGSALEVTFPLLHALAFTLFVCLVLVGKQPQAVPNRLFLPVFILATVISLMVAPRPDKQEWRQRNFVYANLFPGFSGITGSGITLDLPETISQRFLDNPRTLFDADLSGTPWISGERRRHNVLWVILEGVSGGHIPLMANNHDIVPEKRLPHLEALAVGNIHASSFVAQQRQTNRGLYALLCGDYPKLFTGEPRMIEYIRAEPRICLPDILRNHGYETAYIQAAPLSFMMKDQFMPRAGFTINHGVEFFGQGYARSEWGVDDRAFFEQSLNRLRDLDRGDSPWFATLLTAGTHHPYAVPDWYRPEGARDDRHRAFLWMDEAVGNFVEALATEGMLDNTLVFITSDESSGITGPFDPAVHRLSQNWGFLIALTPENHVRHLQQPLLQSDLALSVLDYLGLEESGDGHLSGRSLWRSYPDDRPILFANTYFREKSLRIGGGSVLTCKETNRHCYLVEFGSQGRETRVQGVAPTSDAAGFLRRVARKSALPWDDGETSHSYTLVAEPVIHLQPDADDTPIFYGQYLDAPRGTRVSMDLELKVMDAKGAVQLHHDLLSNGETVVRQPPAVLAAGESYTLSYQTTLVSANNRLETRLFANVPVEGDAIIKVKRATLTLESGG